MLQLSGIISKVSSWMSSAVDPIPKRVLDKLNQVLSGDEEAYRLSRILYFLASQTDNPRYIQILESTLGNDRAFLATANNILENNFKSTAENDRSYGKVMSEIWNNCMLPNSKASGDGPAKFDLSLVVSNPDRHVNIATFNLCRVLSKMPPDEQVRLMDVACKVYHALLGEAGAVAIRCSTTSALTIVNRFGKLVPVSIIGIQMSYEIYCNIRMWWHDEISGKRCAKNIIDSGIGIASGVAGGVGGSYAGAAIGTAIAPGIGTGIGLVVGGIVGGIAGVELANRLCDLLTQTIFDLPKTVALENAYCFLELSPKASNDEVNKQFRKLALQYHPDKQGGSNEKFQLLQSHVGVIKAAREEK